MDKSMYQTVEERRAYINQVRASFQTPNTAAAPGYYGEFEPEQITAAPTASTLGFRTIIAILVFAAFVYCDKENITYRNFSAEEVFAQIESNWISLDKIYK